jgi:hypothetical protein
MHRDLDEPHERPHGEPPLLITRKKAAPLGRVAGRI